jgi:hypothetical protein
MSSALDIITGSLLKLGVVSFGEALSAEEAARGLTVLNRMISSWNTRKLRVPGVVIEEFTLVPGQNSYTIGSGGNFNTTVPVHVDAAFLKFNNETEYKMKMVDNIYWGDLQDKDTLSTIPTYMYIDNNFPLRTIYLYPTPSEAKTLVIHSFRQIASFSTLTTAISLPEGYEEAIEYNLCIRLAPEYGKPTPQEVLKIADESLQNITRANIKPRRVKVDAALVSRGQFNVIKGE